MLQQIAPSVANVPCSVVTCSSKACESSTPLAAAYAPWPPEPENAARLENRLMVTSGVALVRASSASAPATLPLQEKQY
jgi:hypothetical protein